MCVACAASLVVKIRLNINFPDMYLDTQEADGVFVVRT